MDLSQQELPLTAYFTKDNKGPKSRTVSYKADGAGTGDSRSVAHTSKRRKVNAQSSTASSLGSPSGHSRLRPPTLQLPTPAASTRKCKTSGRLEELPGEAPLTLVAQNEILLSENDIGQSGFQPTPSELPQSPSKDTTAWREAMEPASSNGPRLLNRTGTGIATPQTLLRRKSKPMHCTDGHAPFARSDRHLLPMSDQVPWRLDSGVSDGISTSAQSSTRSTMGSSCSPVDLGYLDPFSTREGSNVFVSGDGTPAPKQYFIQSVTSDERPSEGDVMPVIPVSSSQSQYLLHIDATPRRKRCSEHTEHVISSQTQEERELILSPSHKPAVRARIPIRGFSEESHMHENAQTPRHRNKEREERGSLDFCASGSSAVASPASPIRPTFTAKKASTGSSSKPLSLSRGKELTFPHSPEPEIRSPRMPAFRNPIKNILSEPIDDSPTESESDADILGLGMKDKLCMPGLPSREMGQVPRRSLVSCDPCPAVRCGSSQDSLTEDDSATEAESDTEILRCVAEIGKRQPPEHQSKTSKEDTPPPPAISPLISPTRPRIAVAPSIVGFSTPTMREGAGPDDSGSWAPHSSTQDQPETHSESLPSVVRDFVRMFSGDESYPADFPESLRI